MKNPFLNLDSNENLVSNSNYLSEIKKYIKNIKLKKINYKCLD